jgi:putative heme-binding domain-containing protein
VLRLYLASAVQKLPAATAWDVIDALAQHGEDRDDRNIPTLLWQGTAPLMSAHPDRAFALATTTRIPQLTDWIYWYAGTLDGDVLNRAVAVLNDGTADTLRRRLAGLWLAMASRANVPMPPAWRTIAPRLYANDDLRVRRQAEQLGAGFGDGSMFPGLRKALADTTAAAESRKHAFAVLSRAQDRTSLPVFLALLDDPAFRLPAISLVARFDDPAIAEALLKRIGSYPPGERDAALTALTSRPVFALALLDAMAAGKLKRDQFTAFHVRRLGELKNAEVDRRVASTWGRILKTPDEKQALIERLQKTFDEAPLWAYESGPGRQHFQKLCASCHRIGEDGTRIGPELTGAGKNGIRYYLENIVDPDAVIGADFQMTSIDTKGGDTVSGLVIKETPSAVTIRTTVAEIVVPGVDIASRGTSEKSLMPEGLLESLNDREQIELLKFLTTH